MRQARPRTPKRALDPPLALSDRLRRLRANAWPLAQAAIAAALAWVLAREALGHPQPFFAAVAAIVSLGATRGQRGRQALELMLGVAVGIGVADLVIAVLGTGAWQIALVVFGAMATTVLLGERRLMINQAAVSAALVATIDPPTGALPPDRFFDALIGSGIALVFSQILFPDDPVKTLRRAARPILSELAATLEDIAQALADNDLAAAQRALDRARSVSAPWERFRETLDAGLDAVRFVPMRWSGREGVALFADAGTSLDLSVRDLRVIARAALRMLRLHDQPPAELPDALRHLADSVRGVGRRLVDEGVCDDAVASALAAACEGRAAFERSRSVTSGVLVGSIEAMAVDLLRGLGLGPEEAREAVTEVPSD